MSSQIHKDRKEKVVTRGCGQEARGASYAGLRVLDLQDAESSMEFHGWMVVMVHNNVTALNNATKMYP